MNKVIVNIICYPAKGVDVSQFNLHYDKCYKRVIDAYFIEKIIEDKTEVKYTDMLFWSNLGLGQNYYYTITPKRTGYRNSQDVEFGVKLDNLSWGKYWTECIFQNVPKELTEQTN